MKQLYWIIPLAVMIGWPTWFFGAIAWIVLFAAIVLLIIDLVFDGYILIAFAKQWYHERKKEKEIYRKNRLKKG